MKVIVDAYNVLHQMSNKKQPGDAERKQFINLLSAYAKRKHLDLIAVFDAGPFLFPSKEEQKGITLHYSGSNASADDIIIKLMHQGGVQGMLLVSSDRALRDAAKQSHVESVSAAEFIERLFDHKPAIKTQVVQQAVKMSSDAHEFVDRLLTEVKVGIKSDDLLPDAPDGRQALARKESKKERMRTQKLKKL